MISWEYYLNGLGNSIDSYLYRLAFVFAKMMVISIWFYDILLEESDYKTREFLESCVGVLTCKFEIGFIFVPKFLLSKQKDFTEVLISRNLCKNVPHFGHFKSDIQTSWHLKKLVRKP